MILTRLIYASEVRDLGPAGITGLVSVAQSCNKAREITGMLLFNGHYFLQCLEGGRSEVTTLFTKIAGDPRHANVTTISVEDATTRMFTEWSMGYTGDADAVRAAVLEVAPSSTFNPLDMPASSAIHLLSLLRYANSPVAVA